MSGLLKKYLSRWYLLILRHQMEAFSALLAICAGNSPVISEFPAQWPVTRSFDVFYEQCLNKWLRKHGWGWWLETPSRSLWRHCNVMCIFKTASLGPLIEMEVIVHKPALFVNTPVPQFNIKMSSCQYKNTILDMRPHSKHYMSGNPLGSITKSN